MNNLRIRDLFGTGFLSTREQRKVDPRFNVKANRRAKDQRLHSELELLRPCYDAKLPEFRIEPD